MGEAAPGLGHRAETGWVGWGPTSQVQLLSVKGFLNAPAGKGLALSSLDDRGFDSRDMRAWSSCRVVWPHGPELQCLVDEFALGLQGCVTAPAWKLRLRLIALAWGGAAGVWEAACHRRPFGRLVSSPPPSPPPRPSPPLPAPSLGAASVPRCLQPPR